MRNHFPIDEMLEEYDNTKEQFIEELENALDKKYEKDVVLVKKVTVSVNATENPILSYPATGEHSGKTRTWRQD